MVVFFVKRLLMSLLVVLISTVIMYVLVDMSIDPLEDLRISTAPNKAQQIANRVAELRLDDPILVRYLDWLRGAAGCLYGSCDLGGVAWPDDDGGRPVEVSVVEGRGRVEGLGALGFGGEDLAGDGGAQRPQSVPFDGQWSMCGGHGVHPSI